MSTRPTAIVSGARSTARAPHQRAWLTAFREATTAQVSAALDAVESGSHRDSPAAIGALLALTGLMLEKESELSGAVVGRATGQQDQGEQSPIAAAEMEQRIGLMGRLNDAAARLRPQTELEPEVADNDADLWYAACFASTTSLEVVRLFRRQRAELPRRNLMGEAYLVVLTPLVGGAEANRERLEETAIPNIDDGLAKEGARDHGYTGQRGYHPLLAIAAGTGDVLMARLRKGRANTVRGAAHFLRETVGRVRYGGARGQLTVRADSGFYTHAIVAVCREMDVRFSITVRQHARLHNLIEAIPETDWTPIPYWMDGAADVAETIYVPFQDEPDAAPVRLIVRRVKPTPGSQLALFASYRYHGFITDRDGDTLELEADHRRHAEIENAIRDLKYGVGLNHLPSGRFAANGAWLAVQVMAHNLARWTARIGLGEQLVTTKTLRRRFFSLAGRLTRSARRLTLHLPQRWPWENQFSRAVARLRAIPLPA